MTTAPPPPPEPQDGNDSPHVGTQRARWATRKMTVKSSKTKRQSLLNRMQHKKTGSNEKNTPSDDADLPADDATNDGNDPKDQDVEDQEEEVNDNRSLYFNQPLPDEFLDEDGSPAQEFTRNKIRTAKYTPISFIPKNIWFQFHNVANIFFLFLIILGVSRLCGRSRLRSNLNILFIDLPHLRSSERCAQRRSFDFYCCRHFHQRCD